jgi:pyruvate dehydrogenase E2 component (dihydrolipoyllysine-residue acetyltransferase)
VTITERSPAEWTPIRRAVAKRMSTANRDVPQFHATTRIRVDAAQEAAETLTAAFDLRVTLTTMLVAATASALGENPRLNAVWEDEQLFVVRPVNIGIAIALPDGLVAPAIIDAGQFGLRELAAQLRDLIDRARAGALRSPEMTDGTFTLSNLGMYDVSAFAAIVTPPQVAILATGTVFTAPSWTGEDWEPAGYIDATVSCDHRAIDGAEAAEFLRSLKYAMETTPTIAMEGTS